jgi:type IV fimbrial biogenesis protein FimT
MADNRKRQDGCKNVDTGAKVCESLLSGFTLVEVLMTIGVLAVLAAVAVPGFSVWLPNHRLKAAARDVVSNFQLAKLTAVKRNTNCAITFNQAIDAQIYDYVVYVDSDKDLEYDAGEEVITRKCWTDYGSTNYDFSKGGGDGLTFIHNDEGLPSIAFQAKGFPINKLGGLGMGTVFLKNTNNRATSIILSSAGNIRIN